MPMITLPDGYPIKNDIVESFLKAVNSDENKNDDLTYNWDFVSADMCFELSAFYNYDHIDECMEALIDYFNCEVPENA